MDAMGCAAKGGGKLSRLRDLRQTGRCPTERACEARPKGNGGGGNDEG